MLRFDVLKLDLRSGLNVVRVLAAIKLFLEWPLLTLLLQIDEGLEMLNIVAHFIHFSPLEWLLAVLLRNGLIRCHLTFKSTLRKIRVWQHDNPSIVEGETLHLLSCRGNLIVLALLRCSHGICSVRSNE
jgi:hypothetical protein